MAITFPTLISHFFIKCIKGISVNQERSWSLSIFSSVNVASDMPFVVMKRSIMITLKRISIVSVMPAKVRERKTFS